MNICGTWRLPQNAIKGEATELTNLHMRKLFMQVVLLLWWELGNECSSEPRIFLLPFYLIFEGSLDGMDHWWSRCMASPGWGLGLRVFTGDCKHNLRCYMTVCGGQSFCLQQIRTQRIVAEEESERPTAATDLEGGFTRLVRRIRPSQM